MSDEDLIGKVRRSVEEEIVGISGGWFLNF